jgi:hypothetical protein
MMPKQSAYATCSCYRDLVQDFPGANVSLVLLLDRTGIAQHEKNLDAFGQRLLRWPLEQPTRAEGESLLKVARGMGFEVEVKKVLAATGFAEIRTPQPVGDPGSFERHLSDARTRKKYARPDAAIGFAHERRRS